MTIFNQQDVSESAYLTRSEAQRNSRLLLRCTVWSATYNYATSSACTELGICRIPDGRYYRPVFVLPVSAGRWVPASICVTGEYRYQPVLSGFCIYLY